MTTLSPGTKLGPYEVLAPIGAGGMGEVYKAADTRLDRIVAIKVLPGRWASSPEMKQRFEREAQTIASLNHPHICVLHDIGQQDGVDFLVMEYLEGETVAARLERGPLDVSEVLKTGAAIADALDKAHRRGVVHRDLKPSNVMLTPAGPKLLDFGLAKWRPPANRGQTPAESVMPTNADISTPGAVLGTLQYMAPEQLEGGEADARTDIFAFGALLHEMVTGKKAFEGKSRVLLMSAIATAHPPALSAVTPAAPAALDHVVRTCLAKDPEDRWQTARDLLAELRWIAEGGGSRVETTVIPAAQQKREKRLRALVAVAAAAALAVMVPGLLYLQRPAQAAELRFRVPLLVNGNPMVRFNGGTLSISPDGKTLAFQWSPNAADPRTLVLRPTSQAGPVTPLPGTENAELTFWSPDSKSIGFVAGGRLKKVEASGGPPQELCEAADFFGGTWNADGTILFGTSQGLKRIPAQGGGKPEPVTNLEAAEAGHYWPHFLPDGRHFLYTAWSGQAGNRAVFVGSLDDKKKTRILATVSKAVYTSGYLVFYRENAVYAQPFDAGSLALSGEPFRIADQVPFFGSNGFSEFAVSANGALFYVYAPGANAGGGGGAESDTSEWQVSWADRKTARVLQTVGPPGAYRGIAVAPKDPSRVAVHRHDATGGNIWVLEPRGTETHITLDASQHNAAPVWSPDGMRIAYASRRNGKWGIYQNLSNGSGTEELLCCESDALKAPMSWSPDSKRLVFWTQDPKNGSDLWMVTLEGDKKPAPLIATEHNETHGQISPDGKWIAYASDSSGRFEVYVQPFPSGSGIWNVSRNGGDWPRWRADSRELFFHSLGTVGNPARLQVAFVGQLFSALVTADGNTFKPDPPLEVVLAAAINLPHSGGDYQTYDVSPDGQRLLVLQYVDLGAVPGGATGPDPAAGLTVALHWAPGL